ncbi:MAG: hypothetical protein IT464_10300 [Planctomycetes bacterium]|nr:hypothetical protein [Planctomycetota bacterium]
MTNIDQIHIHLSSAQLGQILREVLAKRSPHFLRILVSDREAVVSIAQLGVIQDVIGDELCETGIQPNGEPSVRGLLLEQLIDTFSPYGH